MKFIPEFRYMYVIAQKQDIAHYFYISCMCTYACVWTFTTNLSNQEVEGLAGCDTEQL